MENSDPFAPKRVGISPTHLCEDDCLGRQNVSFVGKAASIAPKTEMRIFLSSVEGFQAPKYISEFQRYLRTTE